MQFTKISSLMAILALTFMSLLSGCSDNNLLAQHITISNTTNHPTFISTGENMILISVSGADSVKDIVINFGVEGSQSLKANDHALDVLLKKVEYDNKELIINIKEIAVVSNVHIVEKFHPLGGTLQVVDSINVSLNIDKKHRVIEIIIKK
ncbi:MAG: hypothetical protein ACI9TY_000870 [Alphaproteobacteria bacterium]|jgi:hypothetical protein